jgi:hypothetical protein
MTSAWNIFKICHTSACLVHPVKPISCLLISQNAWGNLS